MNAEQMRQQTPRVAPSTDRIAQCRHSARTELGAQPTRAREGAVIPEPTGRVSCRVSRANQVATEGIGKGHGMMAGGLGLAIG